MRIAIIPALALAAAVVATIAAYGVVRKSEQQFRGTDISAVQWGRGFDLTDHTGRRRTLADFKGKVVLLFFGFTNCPDACPTAMAEMAQVVDRLGPDVPLHFSAFHPDWKMLDVPATPAATLTRAREIAQLAGLRYVYTGNVHDETGGSTYCPSCENAVIVRDWYDIRGYHLTDEGACKFCGARLAGRFQKFGKPFGPRRIPVRLSDAHAMA